jgi:hypothetical protein
MLSDEENNDIEVFRELASEDSSLDKEDSSGEKFTTRGRRDMEGHHESKRRKTVPNDGLSDDLPIEIKLNENSVAHGVWDKELGLVEMVQLRGNFWRTHGHCENQKNYLNAEEALLLLERSLLMVKRDGERLPFKTFYEEVVEKISMEAYLTYTKLKSLDYVTFRHNRAIRVFRDEKDIYTCLASQSESLSLLNTTVTFRVYTHEFKWAKKMMAEKPPVAYVIIT